MKAAVSIAFGLLSSLALANPNYVNTVRQTQQDSGVEWDVTVAPVGAMISPEGVGPAGSNYELWTLSAETGQTTFLDSEFVAAFIPGGEVEIITGDPYAVAPRTRVDKPFSVSLTVGGLLSESAAPLAAREVSYEHRLRSFPEGTHAYPESAEVPEGELFDAYAINTNGVSNLEFSISNLTGADLTEVEGEEIFSLYSAEDGEIPSQLLDQKVLTVWPIAKAEILGLEEGVVYSTVPPLTITLVDLYPDSNTYVRIYAGEMNDDPAAPLEINDADLVIYDVVPQDRVLTLTNLDNYFTGGGTWTIEVLHWTPWGTERLTYENPTLSNVLRVRAGLVNVK